MAGVPEGVQATPARENFFLRREFFFAVNAQEKLVASATLPDEPHKHRRCGRRVF
jgi:hypothetical protein